MSSKLPILPIELITQVIGLVADDRSGGSAALANIARTSKAMNQLATPLLYKRIVITRRNAARLFAGLVRRSPDSKKPLTKREWDAALVDFGKKYEEEIAQAVRGEIGDLGGWTSPEWDSDPETDDEEAKAPSAKPSKAEWGRRLELFKFTTHLTVVQVPHEPLCVDLCSGLGIRDPEGNYPRSEDDEDEDEDDNDSDGDSDSDNESDVDPNEDIPTAKRQLFPNLTHISISPRAVRLLSMYSQMYMYGDPDHPFGRILLAACGSPKHACVTAPPHHKESAAEFFFRFSRTRNAPEDDVKGLISESSEGLESERAARLERATACLPKSIRTLTAHCVRYPGPRSEVAPRGPPIDAGYGLPWVNNRAGRLYRYFYDDHPLAEGEKKDSAQQRARTVAGMLAITAPSLRKHLSTFEHVDVANNTKDGDAQQIHDLAEGIVAAEPMEYTFTTRFTSDKADRDPELDAAYKAADENYNRVKAERERAEKESAEAWEREFGPKLAAAEKEEKDALADQKRRGEKYNKDDPRLKAARRTVNQLKQQRAHARNARNAGNDRWAAISAALRTSNEARDRADKAATDKAKKRLDKLIAEGQTGRFDDRVMFATGQDAEPCLVCGRGHRSDWDLKDLIAAAA